MWKLTIRGLWAHKLRYALTGFAVVLGVAFMTGTMVLTDTMRATFDQAFSTANEGVDVLVQRSGAIDGDFGTTRERIDASVVEQVAEVDGVRAASGVIQGFAQLVRADGTVASDDGLGTTIGANWIDDDALNPFSLDAGRAPRTDDEAVIDRGTFDAEGWQVGDTVTVLTRVGPRPLTIVGTATFGALEGIPGSSLIGTTDAAAQTLFAAPGRFDGVVVAAESGVTPTELATRVSDEVATPQSQLEAITGEQETARQQDDFAADFAFFDTFLMAFALIALFVGSFIIRNTFTIVVAQRIKEMAMLRAIGARRGQVLSSVVVESIVIGALAAAVGLVAGVGLSYGLRALLAAVGLEIPDHSLVITAGTVVVALVVGVVTSVLSALAPAVRASRVRPIAALRDVAVDATGTSRRRIVIGGFLTVVGLAVFAMTAVTGGTESLGLLGLGGLIAVLGVFVLSPIVVRPFVAVVGRPAAATGVTGRYATENAGRVPKRTAATASALMIGVALVGFITILAASTSDAMRQRVDESFTADYVVDSGSWDRGFAPTVEDDLAGSEVVSIMSPLRAGDAMIDGDRTSIQVVETATFGDLYDLQVEAGALTDVDGDAVAVSSRRAERDAITVGDSVTFGFADGSELPVTVRAVYGADIADSEGDWIFDTDTVEAHVSDQYDRQLFVRLADGVTPDEGRSAIDQALSAWPNADVNDQAEYRASVTEDIDRMLNLIYGLLALAVVISLIGIANTLALSVAERTRELGVLRAVGMHRRQVRRAVRWEAMLISTMGALLGTGVAIVAAWGLVRALADEGLEHMVLPGVRLAVIVAVAAVAGVLAAAAPARRASRLDVLRAIGAE